MGSKVSVIARDSSNSTNKKRPILANAFKHGNNSFDKRFNDKISADKRSIEKLSGEKRSSAPISRLNSIKDGEPRLSASSSTVDTSILCFSTFQKGQEDRMNSNHFALKVLFDGNTIDAVKDNLDFHSSSVQVLDIGCGSGSWIMDMATEYPSAQFTGIDQVALFPHDIRPANVSFRIGDVLLGLDCEDNTFDFVQMRLFSLAFSRTHWDESLKEAYRVTKPGGYIQLVETQIRDPGDEVVRTFVEKVCSLMENNDQDPDVCEKLSAIVSKAGYKPIEDVRKIINLQTDVLKTELMYIIDISIESCKRLMFEIYDIESEEEFQELKRMYVESRMNSSESAFYCCVGQKPL